MLTKPESDIDVMRGFDLRNAIIAVVGLGYVGLPLAAAFGVARRVTGFDIDHERIAELNGGHDRSGELDAAGFEAATHLAFTADPGELVIADIFIVAVPTPVDKSKRPDLSLLAEASALVGRCMANRISPSPALVIYESTVYPGCTEEFCVPILERESGLRFNREFAVGYSPERINPGDKTRRLGDIVKVTSGSTVETANVVDALYSTVVPAGTFKAASITVAEAAKVIENTQRDLNIALMNELSIIFNTLGLDTMDVLEAAGTKWNFLPFRPGIVGGHCIGVDPYYLTHKAQEIGYHPEIILAGRRINDRMGVAIVDRTMRLMLQRGFTVVNSRVLVMGLAFKENTPDIRNSRVIDIVDEFRALHAAVDVWDPLVAPKDAAREYGLELLTQAPQQGLYDAVVLAVGHREFVDLGASAIRAFAKPEGVFFDVKAMFDKAESDGRL